MNIFKIISQEIKEYTEEKVEIFEGYNFSTYNLVKRIVYYQNQVYPKGKLDSHGNYKYWFDIISPRIDSEVKNVDFDTKDIQIYSDATDKDSARVLIANGFLKEWLKNTGQGEKINEAVEQGSAWGNIVWKKVKGEYEQCDLRNLYVINQTARTLKDSPVIERHIKTQSDLREKKDIWKNVEEVIKDCGGKLFSSTLSENPKETPNPYYEIFERNGEVSEKDLFEAQGIGGGSEDKYVLAKVVVAGLKKGGKEKDVKYILYAEKIPAMPYKEYHRGRFQGRWFRVGMYELLMDIQTRSNEIGNQIARGLEWASKVILRSSDKVIAQNVLDDLNNGDIIRSVDVQQVQFRMQGLDQLIADWNRLMQMADKLANSYEVVTGESLPSGTPFRLGAMLNQNANKLFDFIREKLTISLTELIEDWVLPDLLKDLKAKDILRITGDDEWLKRYYEVLANSWYVRNLISFGPHTPEEAKMIKESLVQKLLQDKEAVIKLNKGYWEGFKPRARIDITGERVALMAELETYATFINLELDPLRRTALIERAMKLKNIDVEGLPKQTPEQALAVAGRTPTPQANTVSPTQPKVG